jgi:DNA primase catalytic subunit
MTALQKIQAEAKKIRKAKPNMPYKDAIKAASKVYNDGKLGAAKKASAKLPVKKIVTTVKKEKVETSSNIYYQRSKLETDIKQTISLIGHYKLQNKKIQVDKLKKYLTTQRASLRELNSLINSLLK